MSAVPIHTESPISASKATAITPQTSSNTASSSTPTTTTTQSSTTTHGYPGAQPAAAAPTPTRMAMTQTDRSPPAPQSGAVPNPLPATPSGHARGLSIPPPPKAGEKPQPPSYYAISQAQPTQKPLASASSNAYPQQMGVPAPNPAYGIPPASTTSTTQTPSFRTPASLPSQSASASPDARSRANTLEHPPGYVQDIHAQDMTPDARFATEQQESAHGSHERSSVLPGYNDRKGSGSAGFGEEEGIWDMAKKLVSQAGEKVQEFEGEIWRKFGEGK